MTCSPASFSSINGRNGAANDLDIIPYVGNGIIVMDDEKIMRSDGIDLADGPAVIKVPAMPSRLRILTRSKTCTAFTACRLSEHFRRMVRYARVGPHRITRPRDVGEL